MRKSEERIRQYAEEKEEVERDTRERTCRRTGERNSTEACLPRRTRCKGARTRRRHAFSTGPTVLRDRTTSTATRTKTTMRTRTRTTVTMSAYYRVVLVQPLYEGAASVPLERLTMPGTTRISFLPSRAGAASPLRDTIVPRISLPLRSCLTPVPPTT